MHTLELRVYEEYMTYYYNGLLSYIKVDIHHCHYYLTTDIYSHTPTILCR